jgi:SpoIID/LytB domain protein
MHLKAGAAVVGQAFFAKHPKLEQPLTFEPGAQPLAVNGAGYRGDVTVKQKPGGLMAVNVVSLDFYLRGVVPSEMPSGWHLASYEAQAVAARSYTLAQLHPTADYDLYPDDRDQVYGGIAAETPETNLAIGNTAGQVLEYGGSIITAYYSSSSGGRTSSVHDEWPWLPQVPYLVSVPDPYDYISPHHVWATKVLNKSTVERVLGVRDVTDLEVLENSSGRARAVRVQSASGAELVSARKFSSKFGLGSTDFTIGALSLQAPARVTFGQAARVTGFVRGLGRARLQTETGAGWVTLRRVHVDPTGRFALTLSPRQSTELRLAYNSVAGDTVPIGVAPSVSMRADGARVLAQVRPWLPLQLERLDDETWRLVGRSVGSLDRQVRPGSYRVSVLTGDDYLRAVTHPVEVRVRVIGP